MRKFIDQLDEKFDAGDDPTEPEEEVEVSSEHPTDLPPQTRKLLKFIRHTVIGAHEMLHTPFGRRQLVYADSTASSPALHFIERYLAEQVLPLYANVHSQNSNTSLQSSMFLYEAREIVLKHCNGNWETDAAIFVGSGTTAAVQRMVDVLGLRATPYTRELEEAERPVVFVSLMEHHSNLLVWRESVADVVVVGLRPDGGLDEDQLASQLARFAGQRPLMIGSFSAASNITGRRINVPRVTALLHSHGALAFFDYAAAAPHTAIDFNPNSGRGGARGPDAIFVSPHKFLGGPGTPGLLIARKRLFNPARSATPGGGTVFFVTPTDHCYHEDAWVREEGGTPDIIGAIRTALCFQLKHTVTVPVIEQRERFFRERALARWNDLPQFHLLGDFAGASGDGGPASDPANENLSIVSFMISAPQFGGRFLHHNFVVALLNDLFGIQTRGGCACAGPYAQVLMGMSESVALQYEHALLAQDENEVLRPGFVRLSFCYYWPLEQVDFVIDALDWVCQHGYKCLPLYSFVPHTGEWRHGPVAGSAHAHPHPRRWIQSIKFDNDRMLFDSSYSSSNVRNRPRSPIDVLNKEHRMELDSFSECLQFAKHLINLVLSHNLLHKASATDKF